ncbi:MAG: class I SAM-dependent methyltransferase [Dysgonamonadaceae bacterium]|jgi:demethylmacrocin O-methyltransferase|nr:class I SAM-dependent methyltransferase [Dysgonamonadaceae bacterium]
MMGKDSFLCGFKGRFRLFAKRHRGLLIFFFRLIPFYGNLDVLAQVFDTDKNFGHRYTRHYKHHFRKFRFRRAKVFEIGVGGFDDPVSGGASLRMWKKYFPFGRIVSLDIIDKRGLSESRIRIYHGSQTDPEILSRIADENGEFDLIIDDGSHVSAHVITTFGLLFPRLKDGGIYVIEDLQTSYWELFGGNRDLGAVGTSVNFLKGLVDGLNHAEFDIDGYEPSYFDLNITEIHFYHNMVFIYKGKNTERSNFEGRAKR